MEWKSLETAPNDQPFLILDKDEDGCFIVRHGETGTGSRGKLDFISYDNCISTSPIAWAELPNGTPQRFDSYFKTTL